MKRIIRIAITVLLGFVIGLFGVIVSVFADGLVSERLVIILIILLIYAVMGFLFGLLIPGLFCEGGLYLSAGGVLLLGLYTIKEFNFYNLLYIVFIILFSCAGSFLGNNIRRKKDGVS